MKYRATLRYKIKENHPDRDHVVGGWSKDKIYNFSDIYTFNGGYSKDYIEDYIKHDIALVVGGGYRTDTIEIISFDIE